MNTINYNILTIPKQGHNKNVNNKTTDTETIACTQDTKIRTKLRDQVTHFFHSISSNMYSLVTM